MRTLTALIILLLTCVTSEAQQADTLSLAEVSVTAIKQSASLLRDPVAVTILDAKPIERLNIQGMKDMTDIAPNFYMPEYGSRMTASVYVRGIGARIDQPAVGLNVDNVPYLNKNGFDFDMLDIQRIEVLRGPQSTLYGRNTIAGLINVYTLSPLAWQGVRVMAEGSLPGAGRAGAGVYHRFSPKLGMSVNGMWSRSHGWQRNLHTGRMADAASDLSGRWKTVFQPSAALSVENVLSANRSRQQGYPYTYAVTGTIDYNDPCHYRRTSVTDGLTVRWTRGNISLASITGFQFLHDDMMLDQDFLTQS
ncbi:MAG: TonB-dependent receptor plug domain-containing protein, partial [Duncaniella sp.]|nr:TonB-dependent receptor plug domain-containing protein [Duncaniella sp.]